MKEKMKREMKRGQFFQKKKKKKFQDPQTRQMNWLKMFRTKIHFRRIIPPFFCKSAESGRFFIYLHDSNLIFWAQGIKSERVLGRTVIHYSISIWFTNLFLCPQAIKNSSSNSSSGQGMGESWRRFRRGT